LEDRLSRRNIPFSEKYLFAGNKLTHGTVFIVGSPKLDTTSDAQIRELLNAHLDSAYNLARWMTGNDQDAQDVVQEACVRAIKFAAGYRKENGRAWFLSVVRNTCYTWMKQNRNLILSSDIERIADKETGEEVSGEAVLIQHLEAKELSKCIAALPEDFREVIVLREMEELTYKEISQVLQVPMGTVMSRLARARERLLEIAKGMK
jgi:RNA polymerase sigma factor (sigma-70 family)